LIHFLETEGQAIDLAAARRPAAAGGLSVGGGTGVGIAVPLLPEWLASLKQAWLVVPLLHGPRLLGFLVLPHSRAPRVLDWEDRELLKTVGRQAASYIAEQEAVQAIADARQLEAFNRRFAFVMHDLKNLVSPLSMLLANAPRHADNPEFREDLIATVGDSVDSMKRMLQELGQARSIDRPLGPVALEPLLRRVATERRNPCLVVESDGSDPIVQADADKLAAALGHLAQNALDAVAGKKGSQGRVVLRLATRGDRAIVEVEDDGPGMAPAFVRDELFRPMSSTKQSGYGIGAYQARELVRDMGGRLSVASTPGVGTTMRIGFALLEAVPADALQVATR
jgi:putative PEP-CTERM system histidine kinase